MLTIYGESDGAGGVQNQRIGIGTTTPQYPFIVANANGAYLTAGGAWTNGSSRDYKENFTPVDGADILSKIGKLDIEQWNYINESASTTHIGPIAEDFFNIFGLGGDRQPEFSYRCRGWRAVCTFGRDRCFPECESECFGTEG